MRLLTAREIAAEIGRSIREVQRLAVARAIVPARIVGRSHLWHARDVRRFAPRPKGRPRTAR